MRREPVEPWASAMREAGYVHADRPSVRQLWLAMGEDGPSLETVRQVVLLGRRPRPDVLEPLARALRVPVTQVAAWVGHDRELASPYRPPAEADLLNDRERAAVDEMIRVLAAAKRTPHLLDDDAGVNDEIEVVQSGGTVSARRRRTTKRSPQVSGR